MNILTNYIKKTDNEILDIDELITIINHINELNTTKDNLHLILKLISNLVVYTNCINFDIDTILDKNRDILTDGHIISLVKIYCSNRYSNP